MRCQWESITRWFGIINWVNDINWLLLRVSKLTFQTLALPQSEGLKLKISDIITVLLTYPVPNVTQFDTWLIVTIKTQQLAIARNKGVLRSLLAYQYNLLLHLCTSHCVACREAYTCIFACYCCYEHCIL